MMDLRKFWLVVPVLMAVGCTKTADDASEAGSATPPAVTGMEETGEPDLDLGGDSEGAASVKLSPSNTSIEFTGAKKDGKHDGGFNEFTGMLVVSTDDPSASKVEVTIKTDSLYSDSNKLTDHLKQADFFEVRKYPEAKFVSTSIKPISKGGATHEITGDLTLHGVTKPITFPATIKINDDEPALTSEFTFKRTEFDINYAPENVNDEVVVRVMVGKPEA